MPGAPLPQHHQQQPDSARRHSRAGRLWQQCRSWCVGVCTALLTSPVTVARLMLYTTSCLQGGCDCGNAGVLQPSHFCQHLLLLAVTWSVLWLIAAMPGAPLLQQAMQKLAGLPQLVCGRLRSFAKVACHCCLTHVEYIVPAGRP
jgi:hypothetical protein